MNQPGLAQYYDEAAREDLHHYQQSSFLNRLLIQDPITRFVQGQVRWHAARADSICDVGCGDGKNLMLALATPGIRSRVVINDLSTSMLQETERALRQAHTEIDFRCIPGDLLQADLTDVPACDLVMCLGVLNHVADDLPRFLSALVGLSRRWLLLSFCHDRFLLARRIGSGFRARDLPYDCLSVLSLQRLLGGLGTSCNEVKYNYGWSRLSPVAVLTCEKRP